MYIYLKLYRYFMLTVKKFKYKGTFPPRSSFLLLLLISCECVLEMFLAYPSMHVCVWSIRFKLPGGSAQTGWLIKNS